MEELEDSHSVLPLLSGYSCTAVIIRSVSSAVVQYQCLLPLLFVISTNVGGRKKHTEGALIMSTAVVDVVVC